MKKNEKMIERLFMGITGLSIVFLALITVFLVVKGSHPFIANNGEDISVVKFLFGDTWQPSNNLYGIGYMIVGTLAATFFSLLLALPVGILTALAIAEILPKKLANLLTTIVELLAGVPSVIFGIFGLGFIVPLVQKISPQTQGQSLIAVILILAMMILPTIIALSTSAIKAVPNAYKEGSLGLGANEIQTCFKVIIPAAKSGIVSGAVLAIGRAIGETMAIILVAGNVASGVPNSLFDQVRPMTANIALEMSYATGVHQEMLFATGLVLFIFIIALNVIIYRIMHRKGGK